MARDNNNQVGGDHYKRCQIEPVEYIHANGLDFNEGSIVKYISRHRRKNGAEDIKKIKDFCDIILELDYGIKRTKNTQNNNREDCIVGLRKKGLKQSQINNLLQR